MHEHPEHKVRFEDIKDITEEEDMRTSELFENIAMDIYQVYDDVINNLENVDAALRDIRIASQSFPLNKQMIKVSTRAQSFPLNKQMIKVTNDEGGYSGSVVSIQ